MGIANTISLSTLERRHEIGLLRAVGQTRRQVRSMVRWEAVMVSSIGTLAGVAVAGAATGVLASARPASRAARAEVLTALAAG